MASAAPCRHPPRGEKILLSLLAMAAGPLILLAPPASGFGLSPAVVVAGNSDLRRYCSSSTAGGLTGTSITQLDGFVPLRIQPSVRLRDGRGGLRERARRRREARRSVVTCRVTPPRKYGSGDWLANIKNLPKSRLLFNIREHLTFNTAFATAISLVHALTPQHIIDDLHVSPIPHSIMSGALGLLLVFRTNAAYNRFWEARKVWGSVVNICRSVSRLGVVSLGADSTEWTEMKEYVKLFPFLLKQHLQDERNDTELAFTTLPPERFFAMQEDPNPPLHACQMMSEIVARGFADGGTGQSEGGRVLDFTAVTYRMELEHCLSSLIDCLGMCERILTTPVPRGYSRHTSRFLTVYGLTLPLVLVPHTELFTGPVVGAVCWGLFSIEEIAYFIEQPFDPEYRQLDLKAYSEKIRGDVERMTHTSTLRGNSPRKPEQHPALTDSIQPVQPWEIAGSTASNDSPGQGDHSGATATTKAAAALFSEVNGAGGEREKVDVLGGTGVDSRVDSDREDYSKSGKSRKWQGTAEDDIVA